LKVNTPPRFPRALFIAAFAIAGAATVVLKPAALTRLTPSREERRNRSVRSIVRTLGPAIVAGGRASEAFERTGSMMAKVEPPKPRIDKAIAAICACPKVAAAIGKPSPTPCEDSAWVEVNREGSAPRVTLYWRGEFIQGERMARVWKEEGGVKRIVQGQGETVGSARSCDMARFGEAFESAKAALRAAGIALSPFAEAKRVNTPNFKGAVATIGLRREAPVLAFSRGR